jgi:predicted transcriptional regulator
MTHATGKMTPTEVVAYFNADPMPCLICGRGFQLLGRHIAVMHGMLVEEYCEGFGIPFVWKGHTGLATMAQRQQMSDNRTDDHGDNNAGRNDQRTRVVDEAVPEGGETNS